MALFFLVLKFYVLKKFLELLIGLIVKLVHGALDDEVQVRHLELEPLDGFVGPSVKKNLLLLVKHQLNFNKFDLDLFMFLFGQISLNFEFMVVALQSFSHLIPNLRDQVGGFRLHPHNLVPDAVAHVHNLLLKLLLDSINLDVDILIGLNNEGRQVGVLPAHTALPENPALASSESTVVG